MTGYRAAADALRTLGPAVKARRQLFDLSLRSAAKEAGVGFNTISRVEHGESCTSDSAIALMLWLAAPSSGRCDLAPAGWMCPKRAGHDGPCSARQAGEQP